MNVETANKLVKLRKRHGFSQEALSQRLGVSRQAVSEWERAESSPDMDNLIALSKLYEISIDELLDGKSDDIAVIENIKSKKRMKHKQDAWAAIGAMIAIIIFLLSGLLFRAWAYNWAIFLIIPIFYYVPVAGEGV